jgi:hypothetical protein
MDLEAIERQGQFAHAKGMLHRENPYYDLKNMPGTTGEEINSWQRKVAAWEKGWNTADDLSSHRKKNDSPFLVSQSN